MATGTMVQVKADGTAVRMTCDDTQVAVGALAWKNTVASADIQAGAVTSDKIPFVGLAKWQDF